MSVSILSEINLKELCEEVISKIHEERTPLCNLMTEFGSDKGTGKHNYTKFYHAILSPFQNEQLTIFELGLGANNPEYKWTMKHGIPGASLRGWHKFLPNATIHGADKDPSVTVDLDRIETGFVDQTKPDTIRDLWDRFKNHEYDFIVDDGWHHFDANVCFFINSYHKLKPGGIYIIEDIKGQYVEQMEAFTAILKHTSVTAEILNLPHPLDTPEHQIKHDDNRLVILQKK